MDVVDKFAKGDPNANNGQVARPDKIVKMQLGSDAK
jgi:hypothetical protein